MNTNLDLAQVGPGFSDPVSASQAVFRAGLAALSRPGELIYIDSEAHPPASIGTAANSLLLALLDQDVSLYVTPRHAVAAAYFRFHTGCTLTSDMADADFLLFGTDDSLPDLVSLKNGSEYSPEQSATVVREVTALANDTGFTLRGPGIRMTTRLQAPQIDDAFVAQWQASRERLPRGVDIFFTCAKRICGLTRTTRIEA